MKKSIQKIAVLLLTLLFMLSLGSVAYAATFSDVPETDWAYTVIEEMASKGIYVGYEDGTFKPAATITYAEFTTIVTRAYCLKNGLTAPSAIPGGQWYDGVFAFAASNGLMTANQFAGKENAPITRSDVALLVSNALPAIPASADTAASLAKFADASSLSSLSATYRGAIAKIADAGIVVGDTQNRFNPSSNATRAEAAAFVSRLLAYMPTDTAAGEVPAGKILIAAAASLQNAFEKSLIPEFAKLYPQIEVTGTFDSSGRLQTQIEAGLEADLFFSAATTQMNNLRGQGLIEESTVVNLLENKIVLIGTKGVSTKVTTFENITDAGIIAIGDPESVPAGQYAQEVFTNLGIWDDVLAKSSLGSNVTEVLSWVAAGSAEVGVVYATDAASNADVEVIAQAPEGSLETPVLYPIAMTAGSTNQAQAKAFLEFLKGDAAKAIFESYGFAMAK